MAEYLASIFGTEKDKVNCSFYFKIGACRHGDRCSRIHNKPNFSQTILIQNLYQNPQNMPLGPDGMPIGPPPIGDEEAQEHFDDFFEDVFVELEDKYGEIEEMNVCDNLGDHLIGNVYVKFRREEDAEKAVADLNNRWFNGRPVYAELSPVTDFREACCRQYEMGECTRSGFCNFMHLKPISRDLRRELYGRRRRARSISPIRDRQRRRSRSAERKRRSGSKGNEVKRRRSRSRSKDRKRTDKRSRSKDRKHRRGEERDHERGKEGERSRDKPRDRERNRDRERKDRGDQSQDQPEANAQEVKLTEQEKNAIQNEIEANMSELFGNNESNSYGNGYEESQASNFSANVKSENDSSQDYLQAYSNNNVQSEEGNWEHAPDNADTNANDEW